MSGRHDLIAYLATLATLVAILLIAMLVAAWKPEVLGKLEVFGLGTIFGGLIGLLRLPGARPVATTEKGDVNVENKP